MRTSRRALGGRALLLGTALVLAVAPSCKGNHSALALRPHAGGMGGMGGMGGDGRAGAITKPGVAGDPGVHPGKHVDEPGRSVLTVVHGIVDARETLWCFARVRDGETKLVGDPVPEGGLGYGESLSFESLPHIDAERDGIVPFVITGDLARLDGLDCPAAVALAESVMAEDQGPPGAGGTGGAGTSGAGGTSGAAGASGAAGEVSQGGQGGSAGESGQGGDSAAGASGAGTREIAFESLAAGAGGEASLLPPALRVGALPGLPVGTLAEGYSVLEVADGCLGAKAFTDKREALICGPDYTPEHGSLSAEIVILARDVAEGKLAMQALHASRGIEQMGIMSVGPPNAMETPVTVVDNFTEGTLRPREPRMDLPSPSWGVGTATWSVQMTRDSYAVASELWITVRTRAGIKQLEDGRGYTIIGLGPSPDVATHGFWNPIAFALVDNDPPASE